MERSRIGICGVGAIGTAVLQVVCEKPCGLVPVVLMADKDHGTLADRIRYSSDYGHYVHEVVPTQNGIRINGTDIRVVRTRKPEEVPWRDLGVDIVIESSGSFKARSASQRFVDAGAKRVLISAPSPTKDPADYTVVYGVNHEGLLPAHRVVSNASCTTNVLAPVIRVLHEDFGVQWALVDSIHAKTATQPTLDGYCKRPELSDDPDNNIIISSTGAAKAIGQVLEEMEGCMDATSLRVPVSVGSLLSVAAVLESTPRKDQLVTSFENWAHRAELSGVLSTTKECRLGRMRRDPHSAVVVTSKIAVVGRLVRVYSWYDNVWGFSNRMVDVAKLMARQLR